MLAMFQLMVGLDDITIMDVARVPWMVYVLIVIFVVIVFILLLNLLIAMMSQTCENVLRKIDGLWRLEQISVILLFENMLLSVYIPTVFCCKGRIEFRSRLIQFDKHPHDDTRYVITYNTNTTLAETMEDRIARSRKKNEDFKTSLMRFNTERRTDEYQYVNQGVQTDEKGIKEMMDREFCKFAKYTEKMPPKYTPVDLDNTVTRSVGTGMAAFIDNKWQTIN